MPYADGLVVGVRRVRVAALAADGTVPATPTWVDVPGPQSVGRSYQYSGGSQITITGEDRQLAQINDPPKPVAVQLTVQNAVLELSALPTVIGGTYVPGPPESWSAPRSADAIPHFILEFYAAEYGEGTQTTSDEKGFVRYYYPNCYVSAGPDSTHQYQQGASPQLTIYAAENVASNLAFEKIEKVAALPA